MAGLAATGIVRGLKSSTSDGVHARNVGRDQNERAFHILFISVSCRLAHGLSLEVKSERFDKLIELPLHDTFQSVKS